ncbi:MAG: hypothetical protein LBE15_03330 [Burkholderiales bacterium]|nr:hypothetical protein [Burkholderiales bacterium]
MSEVSGQGSGIRDQKTSSLDKRSAVRESFSRGAHGLAVSEANPNIHVHAEARSGIRGQASGIRNAWAADCRPYARIVTPCLQGEATYFPLTLHGFCVLRLRAG